MSGSGAREPARCVTARKGQPKSECLVRINAQQNYWPILFQRAPTTATVYLDMLEGYVTPQLQEFQPWILFKPPH